MAVKRFHSDTDRVRRVAGAVMTVLATGAIGLAGWIAILNGVSVGLLFFLLVPAGLIAWTIWLFKVSAALDVDLEQRRYTLIRNGRKAGEGALDELGPLRVIYEARTSRSSGSEGKSRTTYHYLVKPAGFGFLELYDVSSAARARKKMEALARRWNLPCRSLNGAVRAPGELDVPLHVRLRDDMEARTVVPLRPEWRVGIGPVFRGHAIVSQNRTWQPLIQSAVLVAIALYMVWDKDLDIVTFARDLSHQLVGQIILAVAALAVLWGLWKIWHAVRAATQPSTIEIGERGVSYGGARIAFDHIEEITTSDGIEIVGDRRVVTIPSWFCPREAVGPVVHELQRLILETAAKAPLR
jgi:hypothetical protein